MNILLGFGLFIAGMFFMSMLSVSKISDLESERYNAEYRAMTHFRKLFAIENIIKEDEENHEFITETIKKIKEVINSDETNQ